MSTTLLLAHPDLKTQRQLCIMQSFPKDLTLLVTVLIKINTVLLIFDGRKVQTHFYYLFICNGDCSAI